MSRIAAAIAAIALISCVGAVPAVRVQLHLRRPVSEAEIEDQFVQRSTPSSKLFREHLSMEQLTALVGAEPKTIEAAVMYLTGLRGAKAVKVLRTNDIVVATLERFSPAAAAFGLDGSFFATSAIRRTVAVPSKLTRHVLRVVVVPRGGATKRGPVSRDGLPFPGGEQTPATIKTRYNIPTGDITPPSNFAQGVGEFAASYFQQSDITTFSQYFNITVTNISVNGPNAPSQDDVEGTLDLEYISGLAPGVQTWWISQNSTNSDPGQIDFSWWCDEVLGLTPMPTAVSISWGLGENNYMGHEGVLHADNDGFRKLGLVGVSVMVASGDTGPGSRGYLSCTRFDPSWPASSPYVTAVGATYADSAATGETSVSFSGGGFSDYFATPTWQKAAVSNYLVNGTGLPKKSFYNASGRGFPDVSALGTNFKVYGPDQFGITTWSPVSGTSCASPTFAAVVTRVNAKRVNAGKSTLGFLNPAIYALGKVGYDVVAGKSSDPDCFGLGIPGFPALAGWDAVSGLGTPDYAFLEQHLA